MFNATQLSAHVKINLNSFADREVVMANLSIDFEVPANILAGLSNGSLERVGGVVRDAHSKQVVAWLRDGTSAFQGSENAIMQAVMCATNGGRYVGATLASSTMLLNVALSGISLAALANRLDHLATEIASLKGEFDHDRRVRFQSALQDVRDVFNTDNAEFAQQAVRSAVKGLFEAQQHFLKDFDDAIQAKSPALMAAQNALTEAMYAATLRARCYLSIEQRNLALKELTESKAAFEERVQALVRAWMGQHPGVFLHPAFPEDVMDRFLELQLRLRSQAYTVNNLLSLIRELRADFWHNKVSAMVTGNLLVDNRLIDQMWQRIGQTKTSGVQVLQDALTNAETIYENFERLSGFELEVHSMRLSSFADWNQLTEEDQTAVIVDNDMLERVSRLSAS